MNTKWLSTGANIQKKQSQKEQHEQGKKRTNKIQEKYKKINAGTADKAIHKKMFNVPLPSHHFRPPYPTSFWALLENKTFMLHFHQKIAIFSLSDSEEKKKKEKHILPTYPTQIYTVGVQQTNDFWNAVYSTACGAWLPKALLPGVADKHRTNILETDERQGVQVNGR